VKRVCWVTAALVLCVSVCCWVAVQFSPSPQPKLYEGKPLDHWIRSLQDEGRENRDRAVEVLLRVLDNDNAPTRALIIGNLDRADRSDKIDRVLVQSLRDESPLVRRYAADTLGMHPLSKGAVLALVNTLEDADPRVREEAADALRSHPEAKEGSLQLIAVLQGGKLPARRLAARVLETIGPDAEKAIPALERCLESEDSVLRRAAGNALKAIRDSKRGPL
jgi:HEAT repeat protein